METFSIGAYVLELLPEESEDGHLLSLGPKPLLHRLLLSREEAAHLAGLLIYCVLQRAAPASAVKAFREMTIADLLESNALGEIPIEEEEPEADEEPAPVIPPFPPGV